MSPRRDPPRQAGVEGAADGQTAAFECRRGRSPGQGLKRLGVAGSWQFAEGRTSGGGGVVCDGREAGQGKNSLAWVHVLLRLCLGF